MQEPQVEKQTQLEKLKQRQKNLQNQIKKAQAKETQRQRKEDTRRKVLVGAAILEEVEAGKFPKEELQKMLGSRLKDSRARQLFEHLFDLADSSKPIVENKNADFLEPTVEAEVSDLSEPIVEAGASEKDCAG